MKQPAQFERGETVSDIVRAILLVLLGLLTFVLAVRWHAGEEKGSAASCRATMCSGCPMEKTCAKPAIDKGRDRHEP